MPRKKGIPNMTHAEVADRLTFRIDRNKRLEFESRCDKQRKSMTEKLNQMIDYWLAYDAPEPQPPEAGPK